MPLYRYVKGPPTIIYPNQKPPTALSIALPGPSLTRIIPFALISLGLIIVLSVAAPIAYHLLVTFPKQRRIAVISPLPTTVSQTKQLSQVAGVTTPIQNPTPLPPITNNQDLTQASNWFPNAPQVTPNPSSITHYTIDIPKLNIQNAVIQIGGNDLKSQLIQYAETANPGEFGSPVIFGHSILRQFYNPSESNPRRYLSIFSTIMTLKIGDEILVNFDGIEYLYKVSDKYEVTPDQVEVLRQRYDRQGLKLITCTPEGTYLRRGVIEAQLVKTT